MGISFNTISVICLLAAAQGNTFLEASALAGATTVNTSYLASAKFEVWATGNCQCADGHCEVIQCSAEAGTAAEVEFVKSRLRIELSLKANARNGRLDQASVQFGVSGKF